MCGRISIALNKDDLIQVLRKQYDIDDYNLDYNLPRYNVGPKSNLISLINDGKRNRVGLLNWGFIPTWAKDNKFYTINAKAETLHKKPLFKEAYLKRRCIILVDGFYEWKKANNEKIPFRFTVKNEPLFALAGLWNPYLTSDGKKYYTCTIITTSPNELIKPIHNRMPVILTKESETLWLNPKITDYETLSALLTPFKADNMDYYQVSQIVNNVRNDNSKCIQPI